LHLVDIAPGDGRDPAREAYGIVRELRKYDAALYRKPRWFVLNKIDLIAPEHRDAHIRTFLERFRAIEIATEDIAPAGEVFAISALTAEGCRPLTFAVMDFLEHEGNSVGVATAAGVVSVGS
jgi:GTP-binding protein